MQMLFLRMLLYLHLLPLLFGTPISSFLNNRLLVPRNCLWTRRTSNNTTLLASFFRQARGECLYAMKQFEDELFFIVEMKDLQAGEMREATINLRLPLKQNQTRYTLSYGKRLSVSFKDPTSLTLYTSSQQFQQKMKKRKSVITLTPSRSKLTLSLHNTPTLQFLLDLPRSSYNEQLMAIWLVFVFLNYQWFYFTKNDGLILQQFKSIKKGWCFRTVSIFWINHTSLPLSFSHQFQRFAEYVRDHQAELVEIGLLLILMIGILVFIGLQMVKLMKKVSHRSKEPLHIRQALDYILIFAVLIIPFEYVLILMPISKLLQIWHLLTLEESHYINYYQHFGKVTIDWVEGLYFTIYDKNFAGLETNFTAAAFIISIFGIEVMIILMELLSHQEFREMRTTALALYSHISTFYIRIEGNRAEMDKCSICLESFSSPGALEVVDEGFQEIFEAVSIAVTRCNHRFHAACIEKWFRDGNQNCPLDRQDLKREKRQRKLKSKEKVL